MARETHFNDKQATCTEAQGDRSEWNKTSSNYMVSIENKVDQKHLIRAAKLGHLTPYRCVFLAHHCLPIADARNVPSCRAAKLSLEASLSRHVLKLLFIRLRREALDMNEPCTIYWRPAHNVLAFQSSWQQ